MKRKHQRSEVLAGAYALHALAPEEEVEYERMLAKSETLRAEAAELQDTAVLLGSALPKIQPPDHLKVRIMAQVHSTPQLSATSADFTAPRGRAWLPQLRLGFTTALGAFALLGAIALGTSAIQPQQTPTANSVVAIQQAKDTRSVNVGAANVADSVRVVWSNSLHRAAVNVQDAELPATKDLQLWLVDAKGHAVDAGVMNATTSGGWYLLNGELKSGDSILATVEPKGGSKQPTTKPVFTVSA